VGPHRSRSGGATVTGDCRAIAVYDLVAVRSPQYSAAMKTQSIAILLLALAPACGKKTKPLGDKKAACENIYSSYSSHQDPKVWSDACMAAPDETVRCVNLIMDEGKDSACAKAVKNPERTKLVTVLNGHG
jgi:hypothetical protein